MKLGRAEYVPLTGIRCCYITCARPCVAPQYQAPRNPLRARTPPLQLRIDSDHLPTGQPPTKIQIHRYKDNLMQSLIVSTILPSLCTVHPLTPPGRATLRTVLAHNIATLKNIGINLLTRTRRHDDNFLQSPGCIASSITETPKANTRH